MTVEKAREILLTNKTFFAAGLVALGEADGVVSGAVTTSADVIRAGLQVIGPRPGNKTVSSAFILITNTPQYGDEGVLVVGDCGVIPYPTAEQLADVACICVERARKTVQMREPKVAFLSYSTKGSGSGETVDTVREAVEILKQRNVDFKFDGELQADAALVPEVAERKAPGSAVAGQANVLISRTSMLLISVINSYSALQMRRPSAHWFRAWLSQFSTCPVVAPPAILLTLLPFAAPMLSAMISKQENNTHNEYTKGFRMMCPKAFFNLVYYRRRYTGKCCGKP